MMIPGRIRRPICAIAVAMAGLALASPVRAQGLVVTITDTNSSTGVVQTVEYEDNGTTGGAATLVTGNGAGLTSTNVMSGDLTFTGTFGNYAAVNISVTANYDGSAYSVVFTPPPAEALSNQLGAVDENTNTTQTDTLKVVVSAGTFSVPAGTPVNVSNSLSVSSAGTGGSTYNGSLSDSGGNTTNFPQLSVAGNKLGEVSNNLSATNNPGPFSLSTTLQTTTTYHDSLVVQGATKVDAVPEPSTFGLTLAGGLLMLSFRWARNKRSD